MNNAKSQASVRVSCAFSIPRGRVVCVTVLLSVGWICLFSTAQGAQAAKADSLTCPEQTSAQGWVVAARDPARAYDERVSNYERAIQACPDDASLHSELAELFLMHYKFDAGLEVIQQGLERAPKDSNLNLDRAAALLLRGQPAEALPILKGLQPSAKGEYYVGLSYRALDEHRASQEALRHAWELGYHDPFLLFALIEQELLVKDYQRVSEDSRILHDQFPNSPWQHMAIGDTLKARQLLDEAEAEYKMAQKIEPNLPFLNHRLGSIAYSRGNYASADSYLRKEIALNPTYPAPYVFLGVSLRRLGRNREALPFLEHAVALAPDAPLAYLHLAIAQMGLNQLEQARLTLEAGQRRFPDQYIFPAKLSSLFNRMGRHDEAKVEAALAQQLGSKVEQKERNLLDLN